jgi:hypothetical protein
MHWTGPGRWFAGLLGLASAGLLLSGHAVLGAWLGFAASGMELAACAVVNRARLREPVTVRSLLGHQRHVDMALPASDAD